MFWEVFALELSWVSLLLASVAVAFGALVQSSIGIGFGLVLVPALALLAPDSLPAVPLLLALPLTALIAVRERDSIDTRGLVWLFAGRVAGTVGAVWLLLVLTDAALEVTFGLVILLVVALSAGGRPVTPTLAAKLAAGATSGLFATTAAIGGPPLALLYQGRPGPELRSTISFVFGLGGVISLVGLLVAGRLSLSHVQLALLLTIPMFVGFALSRPVARFLDRGWLRPAVLVFAAVGGVLAIVRGLTG